MEKKYIDQASAGASAGTNVSGSLPVKTFRAGPVSATIWQNEGQAKDGGAFNFSTVKIKRGYKDKNDEWQDTSSMRLNDLPRAALVATKAYEYLVLNSGVSGTEA